MTKQLERGCYRAEVIRASAKDHDVRWRIIGGQHKGEHITGQLRGDFPLPKYVLGPVCPCRNPGCRPPSAEEVLQRLIGAVAMISVPDPDHEPELTVEPLRWMEWEPEPACYSDLLRRDERAKRAETPWSATG